MSAVVRVRIEACDCLREEWGGRKLRDRGAHDGVEGDVVGSTAEGHTLVRFAPMTPACRARTVAAIDAAVAETPWDVHAS